MVAISETMVAISEADDRHHRNDGRHQRYDGRYHRNDGIEPPGDGRRWEARCRWAGRRDGVGAGGPGGAATRLTEVRELG